MFKHVTISAPGGVQTLSHQYQLPSLKACQPRNGLAVLCRCAFAVPASVMVSYDNEFTLQRCCSTGKYEGKPRMKAYIAKDGIHLMANCDERQISLPRYW